MKGIQTKINKLIKAFESKKKIVFINSNQNYSVDLKKTFTFYSVVITDSETIASRKKMIFIKNSLEKELKILKKTKEKEINTKIQKIENSIRNVNLEIKFNAPKKNVFSSKIDMLLFLAKRLLESDVG